MGDFSFGFVTKEEWNALPSGVMRGKLPTPVKVVRFVLNTEASECKNKDDCIREVQEIQKKHQYDMGYPDINYHFLVGQDGNIYEGRGWKYPLSRLRSFISPFVINMLTIGYLGNYKDFAIPGMLKDIAYSFLRKSAKEGLLHPCVLQPPNKVKISNNL